MVTENRAACNSKGQPLRSLQVLAEGAQVEVPQGGKVRLVYLVSGQKETVTGPCRIEIGNSGSRRVSGTGQVVGEQASGVKTKLQKSENLRRMGGSLQAEADLSVEDMLAMIDTGIPADLASVPRSGRPAEPFRLVSCPPVAAAASDYRTFRWAGGAPPFRVTLRAEGEDLETVTTEETTVSFSKRRYIPGKIYQLEVLGDAPGERIAQDFMVMLPSERMAMEVDVVAFAQALGDTPHDRFVAQITLQQEFGLLLEAVESCRAAIQKFPQDSGFQAALGRTLWNLGDRDGALEALNKAKSLEAK